MSYINDDVQMIKSVIKFIDEDKIVDFLNSIEFEFDDLDVGSYILQTNDLKLIELCVNWHLECDYIDELLEIVDELIENGKITGTAINIVKDKLMKQEDPDIIYAILNSSLVIWKHDENPFENGYYGEYSVSNESLLDQEEVNTLFSIYAKHENWLKNISREIYIKDKESLITYLKTNDLTFWKYDACNIDDVLNIFDEDTIKDYFNGNIPNKINTATYADMLIKCDIYIDI